jgi:hypothetical protein
MSEGWPGSWRGVRSKINLEFNNLTKANNSERKEIAIREEAL